MENIKLKAQKELSLRRLAKLNLKTFLLMKWQRFNQKEFMDNWHYDYLCKILQNTLPDSKNQIKRLILNMPPSYGKTEIIARTFPAWALGKDRSRKFIYISYSDELCKKINNELRALLKSRFWLQIFNEPPRFLIENSQEVLLEQGGGILTTTLRSTLTGYHAHQILIDDPIKVADMSYKAERDRVNNTFKESVISRLQDTKSNITILMQRLGDEDLSGFIQNERNFDKDIIDKWKVIQLKALNKEKEIYEIDDYKYERGVDEPLFLQKHDKEALKYLKLQLGEDDFSTQYQQEPQASEAGYFEPVFFKEILEYELTPTKEYIFVDNAISMNQNSDNRAIVTIGLENYQNSTRYVVKNCKFGIWSEIDTINNLVSTMQNFPTAQVFIESDGGGITLNRLLTRELVLINEKLKRLDKLPVTNTIYVYTPSRKISKIEKIKAMRSYYNTGFLVFLHGCQNVEQIKKELLSFNPEKPFRKDDCIDCIASCIANKDCTPPPLSHNDKAFLSQRARIYEKQRAWRI